MRGGERAGSKKGVDVLLVLVMLGLMVFGLLMIFSTTTYSASINGDGNAYSFINTQVKAEVIGILLLVFIVFVLPYDLVRIAGMAPVRYIVVGVAMLTVFLLLVPSLAVTAGGATRWIRITSTLNLQPAELVKIAVIVYMAGYISEDPDRVNHIKGYLLGLALPLVMALVVYRISSNLSSAIIIFGIAVIMMFVSTRESIRQILFLGGGAAALVVGVLAYVRHLAATVDMETVDYHFRRIWIWQHPEEDATDQGYQTLQALYAIGSGGIRGKGIGRSVQKLDVIPEVHNDMIFSVICEELGFFGAALVLALFAVLLFRCMTIAMAARQSYGKLLVIGVMMQVAVQVALNIMVVTNTMPNTGVSLPFISYGGSSALFLLVEMGLVLKVAREERA